MARHVRAHLTTCSFLFLSALAACATPGRATFAQRAQITRTVNQLFDAMRERDEAAILELFTEQFTLVTVDARTGARVGISSPRAFADLVMGSGQALDERMWNPEVRIDGDLATLWAPYDFHRGGTFSHRGMDSFQLVRIVGTWKIASVAYTRYGADSPASRE